MYPRDANSGYFFDLGTGTTNNNPGYKKKIIAFTYNSEGSFTGKLESFERGPDAKSNEIKDNPSIYLGAYIYGVPPNFNQEKQALLQLKQKALEWYQNQSQQKPPQSQFQPPAQTIPTFSGPSVFSTTASLSNNYSSNPPVFNLNPSPNLNFAQPTYPPNYAPSPQPAQSVYQASNDIYGNQPDASIVGAFTDKLLKHKKPETVIKNIEESKGKSDKKYFSLNALSFVAAQNFWKILVPFFPSTYTPDAIYYKLDDGTPGYHLTISENPKKSKPFNESPTVKYVMDRLLAFVVANGNGKLSNPTNNYPTQQASFASYSSPPQIQTSKIESHPLSSFNYPTMGDKLTISERLPVNSSQPYIQNITENLQNLKLIDDEDKDSFSLGKEHNAKFLKLLSYSRCKICSSYGNGEKLIYDVLFHNENVFENFQELFSYFVSYLFLYFEYKEYKLEVISHNYSFFYVVTPDSKVIPIDTVIDYSFRTMKGEDYEEFGLYMEKEDINSYHLTNLPIPSESDHKFVFDKNYILMDGNLEQIKNALPSNADMDREDFGLFLSKMSKVVVPDGTSIRKIYEKMINTKHEIPSQNMVSSSYQSSFTPTNPTFSFNEVNNAPLPSFNQGPPTLSSSFNPNQTYAPPSSFNQGPPTLSSSFNPNQTYAPLSSFNQGPPTLSSSFNSNQTYGQTSSFNQGPPTLSSSFNQASSFNQGPQTLPPSGYNPLGTEASSSVKKFYPVAGDNSEEENDEEQNSEEENEHEDQNDDEDNDNKFNFSNIDEDQDED